MLSVLAALAVLAQAETATAAEAVVRPDWTSRPSAEDLARLYPPRAMRYDMEGRATVKCVVTGGGELSDCQITSELPAAEGFGEATLKLAPHFRMKSLDGDGQPVAGRPVRIPVRWVLPGRPIARFQRLQTAMACYGQVAHRAQQDPDAKDAWEATAYWSLVVASAAAGAGLRPLAYERALVDGHANARAGAPLQGAELDACLAEARKR